MSDYEYVYIPLTTDELKQEAIARGTKKDMYYIDDSVAIVHVESQETWYRSLRDSRVISRLTIPSFKAIDEIPILRSLGMSHKEIQDYYDNK